VTPDLTPSEYRVLRLRAYGLTSIEVGQRIGVSEQTAKNHMSSAYAKLGVDNIAAAMIAMGWAVIPGEAVLEEHCQFVAKCGRPFGHRGHHGGFREVAS